MVFILSICTLGIIMFVLIHGVRQNTIGELKVIMGNDHIRGTKQQNVIDNFINTANIMPQQVDKVELKNLCKRYVRKEYEVDNISETQYIELMDYINLHCKV